MAWLRHLSTPIRPDYWQLEMKQAEVVALRSALDLLSEEALGGAVGIRVQLHELGPGGARTSGSE